MEPAGGPAVETADRCCATTTPERLSESLRALTCPGCGTMWLRAERPSAGALVLGWFTHVARLWVTPWAPPDES